MQAWARGGLVSTYQGRGVLPRAGRGVGCLCVCLCLFVFVAGMALAGAGGRGGPLVFVFVSCCLASGVATRGAGVRQNP